MRSIAWSLQRRMGEGTLDIRFHSGEVIIAGLMLAADEVQQGRLSYLARLTAMLQVEDLEVALIHARRERLRWTKKRIKSRSPDVGDIEFARFERITDPATSSRMHRLGVFDTVTLQALLHEYLSCCARAKPEPAIPTFSTPAPGEPLEVLVPADWRLEDTIVVAAVLKNEATWIAWQPATRLQRKKTGHQPWTALQTPPKGLDIGIEVARLLRHALKTAPQGTIFRAAGPWLGHLHPSDFGARMAFEAPTGGTLDIAALRADHARWLAERERRPCKRHAQRTERASLRVEWARAWLAAHEGAACSGSDESDEFDEFDEFNDWDDFAAWVRRRTVLEQLRDIIQDTEVRVGKLIEGLRAGM